MPLLRVSPITVGEVGVEKLASLSELAAECALRWSDIVRIAQFTDPALPDNSHTYYSFAHTAMLPRDALGGVKENGYRAATLRETLCVLRAHSRILHDDRPVVIYGSSGKFGGTQGYPYLVSHKGERFISFLWDTTQVGVTSTVIITQADDRVRF